MKVVDIRSRHIGSSGGNNKEKQADVNSALLLSVLVWGDAEAGSSKTKTPR